MLWMQTCCGVVRRLTRSYRPSLPIETRNIRSRKLKLCLTYSVCWGKASSCTGGSSSAPGPGQISCTNEGAQWCCNQEYELCTQFPNQINICWTNFANANANVSIPEANAVESSIVSSSTTSSSLNVAALSRISTTPSATPLQSIPPAHIRVPFC